MPSTRTEILYNDPVAPGLYRMGLAWKTPGITPGQFVMLRVADRYDPLLRRPLAIYKVLGTGEGGGGRAKVRGSGIEILYNVVGKGPAIFKEGTTGECMDVLGPLGNGFSAPEGRRKAVMIAGGVGIASLYLLARQLGTGVFLYGSRSRTETVVARDFRGLGIKLRLSTEDGSVGRKGLVTDLLAEELESSTIEPVLFACGPAPMLKAVAAIAAERRVECRVSLERAMACGIGVCLGCAVKTSPADKNDKNDEGQYRLVCKNGPVFDATTIDWGLLTP